MLDIAEAVQKYASETNVSFDTALRNFLDWLNGDSEEESEEEA